MATCPTCGVETFTAIAPGGRLIELDFRHVWVLHDQQPWPASLFTVGMAPGPGGGAQAYAIPALEFLDRPSAGRAGPYRREHVCER